MSRSLLRDWTTDDFGALERGVLLARHRLIETGFFTDQNLARILDSHPDEDLSINTMGHDAATFEWREGDRNGASGADLIELVKQGHLWLNVRKMMQRHAEFHELINNLYNELEERAPGFSALDRTANLLISSPTALVHYHLDLPVNMLWHLRGRKRVWVYPHWDYRFVSQSVLESVCAGEFSEEVPYDPEFDKYALTFDVEPGQLLTWPQMAPHRVTNLEGLNVSLSTEHKNPLAVRRINVHLANRWLRKRFDLRRLATEPRGAAAHCKQALARGARYWNKFFSKPKPHYTYPKSFKVDPTAPNGYMPLGVSEEELAAPFARM